MMIRLKEERGIAMIVALLVVFVVLILSTVVISQAIHNSEQSGNDRDRVLAVDAAEAGLDWFYNYLQTTSLDNIKVAPFTSGSPKTMSLASAPTTSSFKTTATYYDANGNPMDPSTFQSPDVFPSAVYVKSVGTNGSQTRTMETYAKLTPVYGGFGYAILSICGLNLVNNLTLNGYQTLDADIYVESGDLVVKNQPDIFGSVYVVGGTGCPIQTGGNASLDGNSNIRQNLWANGKVVINSPSVVSGNVTSSTSSISGAPGGHISGNATAGTTVTGVTVGGTITQNSPQGPPPGHALPVITWDPTDWTDPNQTSPDLPYQIVEKSDCASAMSYLTTGTLTPSAGYGGIVVHVTGCTNLSFGNNAKVNYNGNLAILTNGAISFQNQSTFTGLPNPGTGHRKVYLIDVWQNQTASSCASGNYNVSTSNNSDFVNSDVFFYSPCSVILNNNNTTLNGQVLGGSVVINNQFVLNFVPVKVPGVGDITGFNEDIAYIREVVN
jgi:hypothetical protein